MDDETVADLHEQRASIGEGHLPLEDTLSKSASSPEDTIFENGDNPVLYPKRVGLVQEPTGVTIAASSTLYTRYYGAFKMYAVVTIPNNEEVLVLVGGNLEEIAVPLVRVHSRCITGDIFGSVHCECGQQLEFSLSRIQSEGAGIIIYLEQEGRGSGLVAKLRAYELAEKENLDTVDAYLRQDLPIDSRSYKAAALILKLFNIDHIRMLTNNPLKIEAMREEGIQVEREPVDIKPNRWNKEYLRTKKSRMGHLIDSLDDEPGGQRR